ncbi:MAG: sugar ABC transporter permease YjfF, partial [bacterium]|nr:sugar ABC transporter permease YjfF [bacterium]
MTIPRRHRPVLASFAVLLALYAGASLHYADEGFFSLRVFINLLTDNSFLGIVAVGMTFVILSGGIDLSVGAVVRLSSVLIGVVFLESGWPPLMAMLL